MTMFSSMQTLGHFRIAKNKEQTNNRAVLSCQPHIQQPPCTNLCCNKYEKWGCNCSGVSTPSSAKELECRALTEHFVHIRPVIDADGMRWSWSGPLEQEERAAIADYMSVIGAAMHFHKGLISAHYNHPTLWLNVVLLEREGAFSSLTIHDYNGGQRGM